MLSKLTFSIASYSRLYLLLFAATLAA